MARIKDPNERPNTHPLPGFDRTLLKLGVHVVKVSRLSPSCQEYEHCLLALLEHLARVRVQLEGLTFEEEDCVDVLRLREWKAIYNLWERRVLWLDRYYHEQESTVPRCVRRESCEESEREERMESRIPVVAADAIATHPEMFLKCINAAELAMLRVYLYHVGDTDWDVVRGFVYCTLRDVLQCVDEDFEHSLGESLSDCFFNRDIAFSLVTPEQDFEETEFALLRGCWFAVQDALENETPHEEMVPALRAEHCRPDLVVKVLMEKRKRDMVARGEPLPVRYMG